MTRSRRLRFPVAVATATAGALLFAGPAFAHIHTDPTAVQAGTEATVGFLVKHGCEESPTTKLEIQMPEGSSDIKGVDAEGFTSSVAGRVVTFAGGSLAHDKEMSFQVTFTAPEMAGEVPVKIVQTCAEGSIDWIEVQAEGKPEPDHPAPVLTITEGAPTGEEGGHGHDGSSTDHQGSTDDGHDEHSESTAATNEASHEGHEAEAKAEDDDSSSTGLILGGVALAVVVIGGGAYLAIRSRKNGS